MGKTCLCVSEKENNRERSETDHKLQRKARKGGGNTVLTARPHTHYQEWVITQIEHEWAREASACADTTACPPQHHHTEKFDWVCDRQLVCVSLSFRITVSIVALSFLLCSCVKGLLCVWYKYSSCRIVPTGVCLSCFALSGTAWTLKVQQIVVLQ